MNVEEIRKKVKRLKSKYKTNGPYQLLDYLNIRLHYFPSPTTSLLGMYTNMLNGRFIYISSELDYKERSVIAHELGHDQLHRFLMKKKGLGNFNCISNMSNRYEDEANRFAAELLISDASIVDMVCCEIPLRSFAFEHNVLEELVIIKLKNLVDLGIIDVDVNSLTKPQANFLKYEELVPETWDVC